MRLHSLCATVLPGLLLAGCADDVHFDCIWNGFHSTGKPFQATGVVDAPSALTACQYVLSNHDVDGGDTITACMCDDFCTNETGRPGDVCNVNCPNACAPGHACIETAETFVCD